MSHSIERRYRNQFEFLRRQFLQDGETAFGNIVSETLVAQALALVGSWKQRIYTPLVTLWVFLEQVTSADHSCRAAVARLITRRIAGGRNPCSSQTGAYCQARKRLPEEFFEHLARGTGKALQENADSEWLWNGRTVYMFDGTTVSMPDTVKNQQAYPQPTSQTPGVGFPLARVAAIFSLSCGAILDLGIAGYSGKGQGEVSIFRQLWDLYRPGGVVLADALMGNYRTLCALKQRGVEMVTRLNKAHRKADFRRGTRLGKNDHLVQWAKPFMRDMDREERKALPEFMTVREARFYVEQPGFRSRSIVIVTTILDPEEVSVADLAELYRQRWLNELDFCSLKVSLQDAGAR